jgi:adenylate cyclase
MARRLAAILAADVVGYSRLMETDEAGTLAALKAHRAECIDPLIADHGGRIVKLMGDGALVEFASVVDAVACAVAIQRGMPTRNADTPEDKRIVFRIGVNLGDIVIDGDDIYGDGVNVAARLETLAEPGGISISGTVHEHIAGKLDQTFTDAGEQTVKNIARPIRVWRWSAGSAVQTGELRTGKALPLPDRPSIAVLPFTNMSGDPEQEYFSDGITEDIITELSKFSSLFVIARNSSFTFKGQAVDVKEVGRKLGVAYVVEGSVRKAANRVRVTAQLIEAASGNHLWAERYDRQLDDIFAVQDDVVREIATAVPGQLDVAAFDQVQRRSSHNATAYEYILRGERLRHHDWGSPASIEFFQKAIEADPQAARAYANLADWHAYSILAHCAPVDEACRLTRSLAEKALQIAPNDPFNLALLSEAYLMTGDFKPARRCLDRAIALNPNHYFVQLYAAELLAWFGEIDEALRWRDLYYRHDPLSAQASDEMSFEVYYLAGRYEDAINSITGRQDPPFHFLAESAAAHAQAGRLSEAEALRRQFESRMPADYRTSDHVRGRLLMCPTQKARDLWLVGYRKAGFEI